MFCLNLLRESKYTLYLVFGKLTSDKLKYLNKKTKYKKILKKLFYSMKNNHINGVSQWCSVG